MAIIRWSPAREAAQFNRAFGTFFDTPTGSAPRRWAPAVDIVERENEFVVKADLPGVDQDAVNVEVDGRVLTISGERSEEHTSETGGVRRAERLHGSFRRSLTLPRGSDAAAISARHENGVLEVHIPKPEQPAVLRVPVEAGSEPAQDETASAS
jgi:HSP20 family protein